MTTTAVQQALVLVGVFAFALSGGLLGVRRQFDVVGIAVLATVTALGGGLVRDVLLGVTPPVALRDPWLLALPLLATVVTFFFHTQVQRMRRSVEVFDAIGLGVFCATATATAAELGVTPLAAVLLGSLSGVGGGIARDVLAGVTPSVLQRSSQLYAVPAIGGSAVVAVAAVISDEPVGTGVQAAAAGAVFVVRVLAIRRGWTAPVPRLRD